ncbi:hypothetical protein Tco_0644347 [Tanacetum coccineum]
MKKQQFIHAEEKFLKIKQVVEEEQTQPEYLQELLQSLLGLQIHIENSTTYSKISKQNPENKIYELKDKFNGLSIEIRKIIQEAEELRESEARARIQKIIIDDDDDDLGFYAVHPNTIHTPVSQNCNVVDNDYILLRKRESMSRLAHLAPISPEIVEACVDDDDTDDDYDFYDCVDIEEDGGEIDLDISKIVDISLREKLV